MATLIKDVRQLSKEDLEHILSNEGSIMLAGDGKTIYLRLYNSRTKNNYQCIKLADIVPDTTFLGSGGDKICSCYRDTEKVTRCASRAAELCIVRTALTEFLKKKKENAVTPQYEPLTGYPDITA